MKILEKYDRTDIERFFDELCAYANKEGIDRVGKLDAINKLLKEDLPDHVIWIAGKGYSYILNPKTARINPRVLFTEERNAYIISTPFRLNIQQVDWEAAVATYDKEVFWSNYYEGKYYDIWEKFMDKVYAEEESK